MTLLDEIKLDLTNENAALSNTLRKAKILASKLRLPEIKDWLKYELEGYPDRYKLPEYRIFKAINFGTFSGPYQSIARNITLPVYNLPDSLKDFANKLRITEGIGELEFMLNNESKTIQRKWTQEQILIARENVEMENGMVLVDAYQPISESLIAGIIDNIKNKLLDFVLDLENSDINITDTINKQTEKDKIRNMFHINIYGNDNIVTSGENISQNIEQVKPNDINSLLQYINSLGIDKEDMLSLKNAIKCDKEPAPGNFGDRVKKWLGNIITKASSGASKISFELVTKLAIEALKKYYGW
jgi:hypothetical protein